MLSLNSVEELHERIIDTHTELTGYQKTTLKAFFKQFLVIQETIDPTRINDFEWHYNSNDEEFLLYRKNEKGLINIVIHEEEMFAFSYIDNLDKSNSYLDFYEEVDSAIDYEKIALKFFS